MGGAVVDSGRFDWTANAARFPMFSEPDESYHGLVYTEHFGAEAFVARCRSVYQRTTGAVLAPMSAFLLLQGIETVALRVERHVENARKVAEFLRADPRVAWVNYTGFADNPFYPLAQQYLGGRASSLLTFGASKAATRRSKTFYDALKPHHQAPRIVNIGDAKTLCCHPASTTHRQDDAPDEQMKARRPARDDPDQRRHRACRRYHRGSLDHSEGSGRRQAPLARGGVTGMSVTIERLSPSDAVPIGVASRATSRRGRLARPRHDDRDRPRQ